MIKCSLRWAFLRLHYEYKTGDCTGSICWNCLYCNHIGEHMRLKYLDVAMSAIYSSTSTKKITINLTSQTGYTTIFGGLKYVI